MSKGPHLHTSYGEVVLSSVAGTGKLKVKLFGNRDLKKATQQIKENWHNIEFRNDFKNRLVDIKNSLKNHTTGQRFIKNVTVNI